MFIYILASLVFVLLGYGRLDPWILLIGIGIFLIAYLLNKDNHHNHNLVIMESISNASPQRNVKPASKLLITLVIIFLLVGSKSNLISILVLLTSIYHFVFINKSKLEIYWNFIHTPIAFILISIVGIVVAITPKPVGILNIPFFNLFISITKTSQDKGLNLFLLALASVSTLINYSASTPLGDVIYGMKKLKTPWFLVEMMYLIYRYIFILYYVFNLIETSSTSRLGFKGLKNRYKTSMMMASRLFNKSFIMARASFNAMESRLYNGRLEFIEKKTTSNSPLGYYVFIGILVAMLVAKRII